jgi:hypothetical protein
VTGTPAVAVATIIVNYYQAREPLRTPALSLTVIPPESLEVNILSPLRFRSPLPG